MSILTERASLAFYTLLSLAPLLVVIVALAGAVYGHEAARRQIVAQLSGLMCVQRVGRRSKK
jgi:membrane protein